MPSRAYYNDRLGPFLEELCKLTGLDAALPMNTGAEAVETAVKAARRWGYRVKGIAPDRAEIVVANGNFHGRTTTVISFSTEPDYRDGFGPFTPGFRAVPFGDLAAVEAAITPQTAAVLVEPIQGEAGIVLPPEGYLARCAQICAQHNVLLICDEVQTGLGRTGKMFACQHDNVQPDGIILGKALGGGLLPVSAFLARRDVMEAFTPGSHGSTFGGNPLAARVACEALEILIEERLAERSAWLGDSGRPLSLSIVSRPFGRAAMAGQTPLRSRALRTSLAVTEAPIATLSCTVPGKISVPRRSMTCCRSESGDMWR